MPLPLFLGAAAAVAAVTGVGSGIHGAVKMKEANDTMKSADARHKRNIARFENQNQATTTSMDKLGKKELNILASFQRFSDLFEQIQNRPEFKTYDNKKVALPKYDAEKIKKVSVGAGVLMGGIGGAALGTAGGFAAAGATTAAVMALGTASTGTAIASLSGVAATNATLAALGGGAIAAGGSGMALGTTILGATTLGVGILVGGVIFNITGSSLSNKADEAWDQMIKAESEIDKICIYLSDLKRTSDKYYKTIDIVDSIYTKHLNALDAIISVYKKTDWNDFTQQERLATENTVLLVQLLYKMCQVKLVLTSKKEGELNQINKADVEESINSANHLLEEREIAEAKSSVKRDNSLTDEENYCLAMTALLFYFARCDGNISEVEHRIIFDTIRPLAEATNLSNAASNEMDRIKATGNISFYQVSKYMDCISLATLETLTQKMNEVVEASEGITPAEQMAQAKFISYLEERRKNNR